jgi:hypothetical protein
MFSHSATLTMNQIAAVGKLENVNQLCMASILHPLMIGHGLDQKADAYLMGGMACCVHSCSMAAGALTLVVDLYL